MTAPAAWARSSTSPKPGVGFRAIPVLTEQLNSGYRRLGIHLAVAPFHFWSGELEFAGGATWPHIFTGYSSYWVWSQVSMNWEAPTGTTWFRPFGGSGLALYLDNVNGQLGVVPGWLIKGGIRSGGARFGMQLEMNAIIGIYDPGHIIAWAYWPMVHYGLGVYFDF